VGERTAVVRCLDENWGIRQETGRKRRENWRERRRNGTKSWENGSWRRTGSKERCRWQVSTKTLPQTSLIYLYTVYIDRVIVITIVLWSWASEGFFPGRTPGVFSKIFPGRDESGEICFFPHKTKKTTILLLKISKSRGAKIHAPLSDAHACGGGGVAFLTSGLIYC